ncbi:hypothetical protein BB8028_0001g00010 [Beauveria bassiana]|uniref:Phosphatidylcholine-sterol acyltransferase n=1 Tax=Beauveria bassiana TaxID=176275 RepID=A0A2S7XVF7_BEABA|nr:hypothetical protein BB8028_0001g00010 [Beauveria bassiana]
MRSTAVFACACGGALGLVLPSAPQRSSIRPRLIVFGDSYSDNGNGSWIASNGTWPADQAYFGHSFSNGPKWNDVVSEALGLELINLATGGATTDNAFVAGGTGPDSTIHVPSTADQIASFLSWDTIRADDIFVHWSGANDILFNTSVTAIQVGSLIERNINQLYHAGAKTVILADYGDIATFPATYDSPTYNVSSVHVFNGELADELRDMVRRYSTCANIAFVNVGRLFQSIFKHPTAFHIEAEYVDPPTACLTGIYPSEGVQRRLCSNAERHLFFDVYHPVKEVHGLIGTMFMEAIINLTAI